MAVSFQHNTDDGYVEVWLSGRLSAADFKQFTPEIEQLINEYRRLRLLVVLEDFHGWTGSRLWEELKLDLKHFDDIDRVAIVGESRWHATMAQVCRALTTGEVRYFEHRDLPDARDWLAETILIGHAPPRGPSSVEHER